MESVDATQTLAIASDGEFDSAAIAPSVLSGVPSSGIASSSSSTRTYGAKLKDASCHSPLGLGKCRTSARRGRTPPPATADMVDSGSVVGKAGEDRFDSDLFLSGTAPCAITTRGRMLRGRN